MNNSQIYINPSDKIQHALNALDIWGYAGSRALDQWEAAIKQAIRGFMEENDSCYIYADGQEIADRIQQIAMEAIEGNFNV